MLPFLAALGIGGMGGWIVVLSENLPQNWAAVDRGRLQTGLNIGILLACLTVISCQPASAFLCPRGIFPALLVFWIRRNVPDRRNGIARAAGASPRAGRHRPVSPARASNHCVDHRGVRRPRSVPVGIHVWHAHICGICLSWRRGWHREREGLVSQGFFLIISSSSRETFRRRAGQGNRYRAHRGDVSRLSSP